MPEFQDYTDITAHEVDGDDITLLLVDGVTHKMTADELRKSGNVAVINAQPGTSYTLEISDLGKTIYMSSASANTLTVPPNSDVAFPIGAQIAVWRLGSGVTTVLSGSGVTINTANTDLTIAAQYSAGILMKIGTNSWVWSAGGASSSGLIQLSTPTNFVASSPSDTEIVITWDDVTNESTYTVQLATDSGFTTGVDTQSKAAGSTTHTFSGLTASTTYYVRIKAVGDGVTYSDSLYATDDEATQAAGLIALTSPSPATATVISATQIDFAWTNVSNESSFSVQIATNAGFTTGVSTVSKGANVLSHSFTGLTAATHYYFRVKAVGDGVTYSDSTYTGDDDTTSDSATFLALTSAGGVNAITESPTGTWTASGGSQGYGHSADSIPTSGVGQIQARYMTTANDGAVIGLRLNAAGGSFADMKWGMWPGGVNYLVVNDGTWSDSGVANIINDYYRIVKVSANSAKAQRSTDGATWIDIVTFAYTNTAEMFGALHIATAGNKVTDLKGENFS